MARLAVPVHSARLFTWSKDPKTGQKVGVCEASTFETNGGRAGRVYDDAVDSGFELLSPTGVKILFAWSREVRDARGEDLVASVWSAVGLPFEVHILNT